MPKPNKTLTTALSHQKNPCVFFVVLEGTDERSHPADGASGNAYMCSFGGFFGRFCTAYSILLLNLEDLLGHVERREQQRVFSATLRPEMQNQRGFTATTALLCFQPCSPRNAFDLLAELIYYLIRGNGALCLLRSSFFPPFRIYHSLNDGSLHPVLPHMSFCRGVCVC